MNNKIELLKYKKQIILQGPPGTGKTRLAKKIAEQLINSNDKETTIVKLLTEDFISKNLKSGVKIEGKSSNNRPGIIYTISNVTERSVSLQSANSKPWSPSYNNIIKSFENNLWNKKGRVGGLKPYEDAVAKYFYDNFLDKLEDKEIVIDNRSNYSKLLQFHPSYTYEDFVRGIVSKPNEDGSGILYEAENMILADFADKALNDQDNNYILILDEINRANLSSVLGELIYALEYRSDSVESVYEVDGSNELILPPNFYIIGTMNTADRSVGQIDYAIRRRFAFVDVLPKDLSDDNQIKFDASLFEEVKQLFTTDDNYKNRSSYLSQEFEPKDVALGHSYFIDRTEDGGTMPIRLQYEIKPILREYVKDGILKESTLEVIEKLSCSE